MARRSRDWNEGLAADLEDPEFARQFLTAAVEDGIPLKTALAKVIRATGVREFATTVGMPSPNVLRAMAQHRAVELLFQSAAPLNMERTCSILLDTGRLTGGSPDWIVAAVRHVFPHLVPTER